jgi:16S rRNA (guanine527-N7)-methyltransferase
LYHDWNEKINVISRKDIDALYTKHIHSLGIAKIINFEPGTYVLDVGTGGGFPEFHWQFFSRNAFLFD